MTSQFKQRASAEAIFGSAARGDSDRLSDRDYLIVDNDLAVLRRRAEELSAEGWSVASYTFRKLDVLAKKGALFLQHLKQESVIVEDNGGRLRSLINNFQPKSSYETEIKDNSELSKLINHRPSGAVGALWAADVLYVTVRNFGVLKLAELGVYKFSFREVIEHLAEIGILDSEDPSDFLSLRFCKTLYRSDMLGGSHRVDALMARSLDALPPSLFPSESVEVEALDILLSLAALKTLPNPYTRIRAIEKGMIAADDFDPAFFSPELRRAVDKWIRDPRCYAFAAGRFDLAEFGKIGASKDKVTSLYRTAKA